MRPNPPQSTPTIGILYAGELGSSLGRLLADSGLNVVTTLDGRSSRTERLCREAGLTVLPSLRDVIERADIVLSTVLPAAAVELAKRYRTERPASASATIYVDVNAVSPATIQQIDEVLTPAGVDFVDGAIHGLASQLVSRGTLYLSGARASAVGQLFGPVLRVRVLGDEVGKASAFKMMISGMAKGVVALFVEMALAARQAGLLDDLLTCYHDAYPGIMALVERMLPTYPQHAARRGDELKEVAQTMLALGAQPRMVQGAQRITMEMGQAKLQAKPETTRDGAMRELLEAFALHMNHESNGAPG
jgi:3-hydroxyisobutyrate dehydrogenase-like beta-hydroxyacid dehydrogenase